MFCLSIILSIIKGRAREKPMKKILLFRRGLFEKLLREGFQGLQEKDLLHPMEFLNDGRPVQNWGLKDLMESGLDNKTVLLLACSYGVRRRRCFMKNPLESFENSPTIERGEA